MANKCQVCKATTDLRRFAVTIDGDELRAVAWLCPEHGDRYLHRVGLVLGSLTRPLEEMGIT